MAQAGGGDPSFARGNKEESGEDTMLMLWDIDVEGWFVEDRCSCGRS